jgi:hypothetical protein
MTYAKFGSEFPDYLAAAGLSDAAFRTHAEAIMWVYHVEAWDLRIPKYMLRRIAASIDWETAVKDLTTAGYWADDGDAWVIRHHGTVILASLSAQAAKRERDRKAQQRHRGKQRESVSADASAYQTDRQTDKRSKGSSGESAPARLAAHPPGRPYRRCGPLRRHPP